MPTKNTLEKDVAIVLAKINDITRNQFIIDLMILVQGINFLFHPESAHKGIVEALAIATFFAAFGIFIGFILSHGFNRQNLRAILLSAIFMTASVVVYFTAGFFAPAFHYSLALAIIASGVINILSAYHLVKLTHIKKTFRDQRQDATISSVSSALERSAKLEAERVFSPALVFSNKITKFRLGQFLINFALVLVGIVMLFFRFQTNAILLRVSGGILIFSAVSDFVALIWTHHESAFAEKITHNSQDR